MPRIPNIPKRKLPQAKATQHSLKLSQLLQQGMKLHLGGQLEEAKNIYEQINKIDPNHFDALQLLGAVAVKTKNYGRAIELLTKAISINPNFADAYYNRGIALKGLNRLDEALINYDQAIKVNPNFANAYLNRGIILKELDQLDDSLKNYDKVISLQPNSAEAYNNRGIVLKLQKRMDAALESYNTAISLNPNYADPYNNRGILLKDLKHFDEALTSFVKAQQLVPNYAEAFNNHGIALVEQKRFDEALEKYNKAISLRPDYAEPYYNRGNLLMEQKHFDAAEESFHKAISLNPDYAFLPGKILNARLLICDWSELGKEGLKIVNQIKNGGKVSDPFVILAITDCPSTQRMASAIYTQTKYPLNNMLGAIPKHIKEEKIRVGYFSADFKDHAVAYLTAELFEIHDRTRFEIIAFSLQGAKPNEMVRQRLTKAFDQFIDVSNKSDQEVAQLARDLKIDIAVDLGGFTANSRTGIFSYRAAPIQISYIGYLGTMGAEYYDYLLADETIIPVGLQKFYSEKIAYLPSYQANDRKRIISDRKFIRGELGLPETGFIFCCFNNNYKILPSTLDGWIRILNAVEGSVLFLYADNDLAKANLIHEADLRGVDSARLIFGGHLPRDEYLARYRVCDLFLDTFPYNAGTTASDALWAGLPVLTLMGQSFASRMAASLLNAIGLSELITSTQEEYEALAIELAKNLQGLSDVKLKLARNLLTTHLFDTPFFTKNLEATYTQIMERYWGDLAPEHIEVDA